MGRKRRKQKSSDDLTMLDDLIARCWRGLKDRIEDDAKVGDLIKMIELKRKLTPADSDQKKFWRMLDNIRKDTLPATGSEPPKSAHVSPTDRKIKRAEA